MNYCQCITSDCMCVRSSSFENAKEISQSEDDCNVQIEKKEKSLL